MKDYGRPILVFGAAKRWILSLFGNVDPIKTNLEEKFIYFIKKE